MGLSIRVKLDPGDCCGLLLKSGTCPAQVQAVAPGSKLANALALHGGLSSTASSASSSGFWIVSSIELDNGDHVISDANSDELMTILKRTSTQNGRILVLTKRNPNDTVVDSAVATALPQHSSNSGNQPTNTSAGTMVVTSAFHQSGDKVGITLQQRSEGKLIVSKVRPDGMFAGTQLQEGMELLSINGISCHGMDVPYAVGILQSTQGQMVLELSTNTTATMKNQAPSTGGSGKTIIYANVDNYNCVLQYNGQAAGTVETSHTVYCWAEPALSFQMLKSPALLSSCRRYFDPNVCRAWLYSKDLWLLRDTKYNSELNQRICFDSILAGLSLGICILFMSTPSRLPDYIHGRVQGQQSIPADFEFEFRPAP